MLCIIELCDLCKINLIELLLTVATHFNLSHRREKCSHYLIRRRCIYFVLKSSYRAQPPGSEECIGEDMASLFFRGGSS